MNQTARGVLPIQVSEEVRAKLRAKGYSDERIDAAYQDMRGSRALYAAAGKD